MQEATLSKIKELHDQGYSYRKIGPILGIPWYICRNAVQRDRDKVSTQGLRSRIDAAIETVEEARTHLPTVEKIRAKRAANVELLELRQLATRKAMVEELKEAIKETGLLPVSTPDMVTPASKYNIDSAGILLLSDVHLGQLTESRLASGYTYDTDTTRQQFGLLYQQVAQEAQAKGWSRLVILDLGDTIDGANMRPSQHRHVEIMAVQQTAMYGRLLAEFISGLLHFVPVIQVERVPGNHARLSQKPGLGGLDEIDPVESFDWLGGEFAREILRDAIEAERVTINNHASIHATASILGYRVLFEHGSAMRGGGGGVGIPLPSIKNALTGYRELEGTVDLYCLGHFHQPYSLNLFYNTLVVGNGSFPATSPFVVSSKKNATRPSQTLLTIERGRGVTSVQNIWLDVKRSKRGVAC